MAQVFISYRREQADIVTALLQDIEGIDGHNAWVDRHLRGDKKWWDGILDAIEASDAFMPVYDKDYDTSYVCSLEIAHAQALGKPIIPVLVGGVDPATLQPRYSGQWNYLFYDSETRESAFELGNRLNVIRGVATPSSSPADPVLQRPSYPADEVIDLWENIHSDSLSDEESQSHLVARLAQAHRENLDNASLSLLINTFQDKYPLHRLPAEQLQKLAMARSVDVVVTEDKPLARLVTPAKLIFGLAVLAVLFVAGGKVYRWLTGAPVVPGFQAGKPAEPDSGPAGTEAVTPPVVKEQQAKTPVEVNPDSAGSRTAVPGFGRGKFPEMVLVPAGSFLMGATKGDADEMPQHEVTLEKFYLGKHEVTFDQFDAYAKAENLPLPQDNGWGRGARPATNISWHQAVAYTQWLTSTAELRGKPWKCSLPSEAQWEYAARAGTDSRYWWGKKSADRYTWHTGNAQGSTQPVGILEPNAFGLHDMSGNVLEWVQDVYHTSYGLPGRPDDGSAWQSDDSGMRVLRGGSWFDPHRSQRITDRYAYKPGSSNRNSGFRVACRAS